MCLLACSLLAINTQAQSSSYRAAIVEFSPDLSANNSLSRAEALGYMGVNLDRFDALVSRAVKNQSEIIVFPEYGVYGDGTLAGADWTRAGIFPFAESIPNPQLGGINPCATPVAGADVTNQLSCMAKKHNIVLVADLADKIKCTPSQQCRSDGYKLFNTAVAFSNDGTLLAKYHKRHLFGDEAKFFERYCSLSDSLMFCWDCAEHVCLICSGIGTPSGNKTSFDVSFGTTTVQVVT
jgi:predicted amidohydrolase